VLLLYCNTSCWGLLLRLAGALSPYQGTRGSSILGTFFDKRVVIRHKAGGISVVFQEIMGKKSGSLREGFYLLLRVYSLIHY